MEPPPLLLIRKRFLKLNGYVDMYLLSDPENGAGNLRWGPLLDKSGGRSRVNSKLAKFVRVDRLPPGNTASIHVEDALKAQGLRTSEST